MPDRLKNTPEALVSKISKNPELLTRIVQLPLAVGTWKSSMSAGSIPVGNCAICVPDAVTPFLINPLILTQPSIAKLAEGIVHCRTGSSETVERGWQVRGIAFTAAQAAQKTTRARLDGIKTFTAAQAAQKRRWMAVTRR